MRTGRRFRFCLAFLVAAGAMAACGTASKSLGPVGGVTGRYTLTTVNGSPLPYATISSSALTNQILDNEFTLSSDGTWTSFIDTRVTSLGVAPYTIRGTVTDGTYTISGNMITMEGVTVSLGVSSPTHRSQGTVATDGSISIVDSGLLYLFRR